MSEPDPDLIETVKGKKPRLRGADGSPFVLHLFGERLTATYPLPAAGSVVIGRSGEADISVDEPSLSRRHARLTLGAVPTVEDLGSANGTRVAGRELASGTAVPVRAGEVVDLGSVLVVLQPVHTTSSQPRRIFEYAYFEDRLEEQCTRASAGREGEAFAVALLHAATPARAASLQQALVTAVSPSDVLARYGPADYGLLMLDHQAEQAGRAAERLAGRLAEQGFEVTCGVACFPRDGSTPHALLAHAYHRALGPTDAPASDGGDAARRMDGTMRGLHRLARRVAAGTISVLLLGETGVGKEVLAETIHRLSPRAERRFVRINCAALTDSLFESELFGHERGAFTGAGQAKPGLLEMADGGTALLDEIGELQPRLQAKLLRALDQRQILRVGATTPKQVDVRFIAATNRDLQAAMQNGSFREDLYYRVSGATLVIPPLRERLDEIPELVGTFLETASRAVGRADVPGIADEALQLLRGYHWPGNIRELRNAIERAVLLCEADEIRPVDLPLEKLSARRGAPAPTGTPEPGGSSRDAGSPSATPEARPLRDELDELEYGRILAALERCGGNQSRAAKLLGISRGTLAKRLDAYGIPRPRARR